MAHTFVSTSGVVNFTAGTSEAFTPAVALAVGIRAVVIVAHDTSGTVTCTSVTDNGGNTYTRRGTDLLDSVDAYLFSTWEATIATGATIVTANYSASCGAHRVIVTQYTGLDSTIAALVVKAVTSTASAATDFYTSGTLTPGSQPGVLIGYYANGYNSVATAGTGFFDRALSAGQKDSIEDKSITALTSVASTFSVASPLGGAYITIGIYIPDAAATAPAPTGWKKYLAALGQLASNVASFVASFTFADVGTTGWTIPVPTAVTGLASTYLSLTQAGSRLFYIDAVAGVEYNATPAPLPYFWNGTNIVDSTGSTTGAGAVLYGTDPLNPTGPIVAFKRYANAAIKNGADYTDTTNLYVANVNMSPVRVGFPDWWLFKRGGTIDLYSDIRGYFDLTGRAATNIPINNAALITAGGASSSTRAVMCAYGPTSLGRARFINPMYGFISRTGTACAHSAWYGLLLDGSVRDRALRPVDWTNYSIDSSQFEGATALNLNAATTDWYWEDLHFYATIGLNLQYDPAFTTPMTGIVSRRCLVTDGWDECANAAPQAEARKGAAVADQTFAANTVTKVTWPTLTSGSGFAADQLTTANSGHYKAWVLSDVTANLGVSGTIELVPYLNGAEVVGKSVLFNTSGNALNTYQLHGILYFGATVAGDILSVYIRTTNASGTITVLGNNVARLVCTQLTAAGGNGIFMGTQKGTQFDHQKGIHIRNGFNALPTKSPVFLPTSTSLMVYSIYNHNIYFAGDCDYVNCHFDENVSLVGGAGDTTRSLCSVNRNFIYQGYFSTSPSHRTRAYTAIGGSFNDNVLQKFVSAGSASHPGWGPSISNGTIGYQIQRNIVSEVAVASAASFSVKIIASETPYYKVNELLWRNDLTNTSISGNIFDANYVGAGTPYVEANGQAYVFMQYQSPITGTVATGQVLTCTPVAGYTGTPSYQWYLYTVGTGLSTDTAPTAIAAQTAATYTLLASDIANDTDGNPWYKVACLVSGIAYPVGTGITGTTVSNNTWISPTAPNAAGFYLNQVSSPATTSPPATSNTTFSANGLYATLGAAASALGWTNQSASLGTYIQALGIAIPATDGMQEYYNTVIGANPILTAMRRGHWDDRFEAKKMGNHVRAGRNMAVLP